MGASAPAYAKLNLSLDILGKRPDGYHDMRMVMQSISLCDDVSLHDSTVPGIRVSSNMSFLPSGSDNIAAKAAIAFFKALDKPCPDLDIHIEKHTPVCAGMAGGSSDGAAVLRLLRESRAPHMGREELEAIAAQVGSDVPFCVRGGTVLCEGRGELMTDLPPLPPCWLTVVKPDFPISTPELFAQVRTRSLRCHPDTQGMIEALQAQDLDGIAHRLYNVFEDVLPRQYREVMEIKHRLLTLGAMAASMTGSGPTVFGLFEDRDTAEEAADTMKKTYSAVFSATPAGPSV